MWLFQHNYRMGIYRKKSKKGPGLYFFRVFLSQALKRIGPKIEYGLLYLKLHWGKQILRNKTKNTKHWGMCRMLFCPVIIGKHQTWLTKMATSLQHGEITA